jgi:hypothetical protein
VGETPASIDTAAACEFPVIVLGYDGPDDRR